MAKLYDIVQTIKNIALSQPSVETSLEGSIYQLNETKDVKYAAVVLTQGQHTLQDGFIRYNFTIFFVDRLTASGDNRLIVQSTAVDTLANIINSLSDTDIDLDGDVNITTFTERFEAECAGAYASVAFLLPIEGCAEYIQ